MNGPKTTFPRALRSSLLRLSRSPLAPAHAVCALAGGGACGAYFACEPWDPALGTDAFAQFLGGMMPLMAGIACGLAVDEERRAGRLANLVGSPSRTTAVLAELVALWCAGLAAIAVAVGTFAAILAAAGRLAVGADALALAVAGAALGSAPLYALSLALSLRFGRNVAVAVGAGGLLVAFFSVGGLANGLMTGELAGARPLGAFGLVPFSWPARLASLAVESSAAVRWAAPEALPSVVSTASVLTTACLALTALAAAALAAWFVRFEEKGDRS